MLIPDQVERIYIRYYTGISLRSFISDSNLVKSANSFLTDVRTRLVLLDMYRVSASITMRLEEHRFAT